MLYDFTFFTTSKVEYISCTRNLSFSRKFKSIMFLFTVVNLPTIIHMYLNQNASFDYFNSYLQSTSWLFVMENVTWWSKCCIFYLNTPDFVVFVIQIISCNCCCNWSPFLVGMPTTKKSLKSCLPLIVLNTSRRLLFL